MLVETVTVVPYDAQWPRQFEAEVSRLRPLLGEGVVRFEHFGSTAIPGCAAKPVIDLLILFHSMQAAAPLLARVLPPLGYTIFAERSSEARMFYIRRDPAAGVRTHHLHAVEPHNPAVARLAFRDYLRSHPEEVARYERLKRRLAVRYPSDLEAYTRGKKEFIDAVYYWAMKNPNSYEKKPTG